MENVAVYRTPCCFFPAGGKVHGPRGPNSKFFMIPKPFRILGLQVALSVKYAQVFSVILQFVLHIGEVRFGLEGQEHDEIATSILLCCCESGFKRFIHSFSFSSLGIYSAPITFVPIGYRHGCYGRRIGNQTQAFEWYQFQ